MTWFSDASFWNPPSPWNTDPKSVEGAITQKTGLTFDFNIPAQDGGTKLSLMLATSEKLPDIITVTDGKLVKKLIDSGKVWNMEEFLKKYDPSSTLLANFPQDMKQALIATGRWLVLRFRAIWTRRTQEKSILLQVNFIPTQPNTAITMR